MNNKIFGAVMIAAILLLAGCGDGVRSQGDHEGAEASVESHEQADGAAEEHGDEGEEEGEPDFARISPERAPSLGIAVSSAAGGAVAETVTLTGRLIIDPKRIAGVRARFPGPVVRVHKEVGETVARGEALAEIESNESLTVYTVSAPISGVVLERMTNVGDVAGTDAIYRIGDISSLQAELKAFPSQRAALSVGAPTRVQLGQEDVPGKVIAIAPQLEGRTQALDVRVALQRPDDTTLVAGQFVTGVIEHGRADVSVAVPFEAVQRLQGREVVFVPEAEGFRARPVEVGRRGATLLEIRSGLAPGESFVSDGAFLLKAEIGKNEAGDED